MSRHQVLPWAQRRFPASGSIAQTFFPKCCPSSRATASALSTACTAFAGTAFCAVCTTFASSYGAGHHPSLLRGQRRHLFDMYRRVPARRSSMPATMPAHVPHILLCGLHAGPQQYSWTEAVGVPQLPWTW